MLAWLERNQFLALGAAGLLLLAALMARSLLDDGPPPALIVREAPAPQTGPVRVHVAGAVHAPGVYELPAGARVGDAIDAAGGALDGVSAAALNLARHVRDGERIDVPSSRSRPAAVSPGLTDARLDLNTASQSQLMTIEGIGEAYSRRIVDSRTADGPFRTVDDLRSRNILPAAVFEKVRDYVTVGP